jgi:hypothetical protein
MKVVFTESALEDFDRIAEESKRVFGNFVAAELEKWFRLSIARNWRDAGDGRACCRPA